VLVNDSLPELPIGRILGEFLALQAIQVKFGPLRNTQTAELGVVACGGRKVQQEVRGCGVTWRRVSVKHVTHTVAQCLRAAPSTAALVAYGRANSEVPPVRAHSILRGTRARSGGR
jgi:hypothetical protein